MKKTLIILGILTAFNIQSSEFVYKLDTCFNISTAECPLVVANYVANSSTETSTPSAGDAPIAGSGSAPVGSWTDVTVGATPVVETVELQANTTYIFTTSGQTDLEISVTSASGTVSNDNEKEWNNVPDGWYGVPDTVWVTTTDSETVTVTISPYDQGADSLYVYPVSSEGIYPNFWGWNQLTGEDLVEIVINIDDTDIVQVIRYATWDDYDDINSWGYSVHNESPNSTYQEVTETNLTGTILDFSGHFNGSVSTNRTLDFWGQCDTADLVAGNFKNYNPFNIGANISGTGDWEKYLEVECIDNSGNPLTHYLLLTSVANSSPM